MINNMNIFDEKNGPRMFDYYSAFNGEIIQPLYPEGQNNFTIIKFKSEKGYGQYSDNEKIEFSLKDESENILIITFFLKFGKNNNFGKFLYQVLGSKPENEINLKELEGKKIVATIFHFYNNSGNGYANIAFCKPALIE